MIEDFTVHSVSLFSILFKDLTMNASEQNTPAQNALSLVGRILLALLFIPAGLSKIGGFDGTVGYIASKGLPMAALGAVLAIVIEVGVALALLAGYKTRIAAVVLAGFTLVATVVFHNFWAMPADAAFMQQLMFFKNIAVIGGLLTVAAWGAGKFSVDAKINN
jgi:putative oxidoreductase